MIALASAPWGVSEKSHPFRPTTKGRIGNPLDDGTWTYEWQAGRQLKSMTNAATGVTMEFTYNHAGIRTKKVKKVNGVLAETTEYMLNGKIVVGLTHTDHASNEVDTMWFFYDAQGKVAQVNFNGSVYSYVRNLQGDIVGMLDNSGSIVVVYKYDAWGRAISTVGTLTTTVGKYNLFRYRGYNYDEETGLYYLRSRYYNPVMERFVNADTRVNGIGSAANVYCYCNNSSLRFIDPDGCYGDPVVPAPIVYPTPAPSRPITWMEDFEQHYYFSTAGIYYHGAPNSHRVWQNSKGEWLERWYGDDGTPVMDRHWTNHGNPKEHPFIPHDEDWTDNGKGGKTIDSKNARPSPKMPQSPRKLHRLTMRFFCRKRKMV